MQDIAFYYPGHIWYDTDRIKSMLLFFDGVGFLIPEYKQGEPERLDPVLAGPLREHNLLHYFVADEVIDTNMSEQLANAMGDVITSGALTPLASEETAFHSLSMSRLGYGGNRKVAEDLFNRLRGMGLARDSEDGSSIPMHPTVRYLILVMLAQILRAPARAMGLELAPITDRTKVMRSLHEILDLPSSPSAGRIVEFDLQTVSVDLSSIPLDEVLDFRSQHLEMHQKYMRGLRRFAREISLLPVADQDRAMADRQAELDDYASDVKQASRKAWHKPATLGLGLAGAAWAATTGNPISALFALGGAALSAVDSNPQEISAYSYMISLSDNY